MKKIVIALLITAVSAFLHNTVYAKTINEADTQLSDTFKYALISSLRKPVDQAVIEIYKDDKDAPEGLTWATYDTEILKIKQLYAIGGQYEMSLKIFPYYRAHMSYGIDEVVINTNGELISFKHLKTLH